MVTDAMRASSTVAAKIPGIPTVQFSGSTLHPAPPPAAAMSATPPRKLHADGGGGRRACVPGVGEAAGGGLEAHDAAQRRRHPDGTWREVGLREHTPSLFSSDQ